MDRSARPTPRDLRRVTPSHSVIVGVRLGDLELADNINTIATVVFSGDPDALADLSQSQSDWLEFYRRNGAAMFVDVDYLEQIDGPGKIEMILHIGSLHNYVCNAA
jgi:hypothetical protein